MPLKNGDLDNFVSLSEREIKAHAIAANDAFTAALAKAIKRGREKVTPGIFVDTTPSSARRIRGDVALSPCGSPAAMCAESGYAGGLTGASK
jgi:hypothetical protein